MKQSNIKFKRFSGTESSLEIAGRFDYFCLHYDHAFSRSTDAWRHITDLVLAKGKTKEVYCCDIHVVVLIVLFWCFWCVKDYKVKSVYRNIVWWGCKSISINWLLFSPLPKPGQLTSVDRENFLVYKLQVCAAANDLKQRHELLMTFDRYNCN